MLAAAALLTSLHLIFQAGFLGVTSLLLLVTVMNRMRVRHVLLSWRTGKLLGLPVWPTLFLGAVVLFFIGSLVIGQAFPLKFVTGYLVGGVFWFVASLLSSSVLVTKHGFICHPHRAGQAVAWGQVVDYFETHETRKHRYVFFYLDPAETRRRLALDIPHLQQAAFSQVVAEKLDARFERSAQQVYGKKALEG
jgi:hypothetical protein